MLNPHERASLFEALRPPEGAVLDAAVGTSFTLDLEALLTAPIAFALYEASQSDLEEAGVEPVGLLEAIRRHAERITLFCQAGQIAVPARRRLVFAWLEDSVVEVLPPRRHRLFHPKVWVARYRWPNSDDRVLRVLCATRNLTFDTSWDTLLRAGSERYEADPAGPPLDDQAQLSALFRTLPSLSQHEVVDNRRTALASLADDLERVPMAAPEPFTRLRFHALGLADGQPPPFPERSTRALVVSPFLGEGFLRTLTQKQEVTRLVSREESLDRLPPDAFVGVAAMAVLNPAVDISPADPAAGGTDEASTVGASVADEAGDPERLLAGLHAKLYLFDTARGTRLFTGSANATEAAFDGNVEVLAELQGPASVGVAALLAETEGETNFVDLMADYRPLPEPVAETEQEQLELRLETLRRGIAATRFVASVAPGGDDFVLSLTGDDPLPTMDADELELSIWPVTLDESSSARPLAPGQPAKADFTLTLEGLTSFFAVRVSARRGQVSGTSRFLVNTRLEGVPKDRHSRLLAGMLRDPDRLLRYLLMLLADEGTVLEGDGTGRGAGWWSTWAGAGWGELPLLELLLRALDRYPQRLDHIDQLLRDLADERDRVLPEGFDAVWKPVWRHREEAGE